MVIVFDDLHWADRGSLFLLRHVLHVTTAAPLLVIGTYRDGEVTADHPLAELLPMLRRETDFTAMQLGGLATAEIAELIGNADAAELAAAIHGETGGNPFFVAEVVRSWQSGETTSDTVPEGVRQLVSRRIARLSPNAQRLLTHASVFNAGFDFAVLPYLTELSEDDLLEVIDELLAARLIESAAGRAERYDFVHAIVRRTIVETTNPSRRVRLERAAAEALERTYTGRTEPHAAEIAALYHRSASLPGTEAGVPHALAAAEAARRGFDRSSGRRISPHCAGAWSARRKRRAGTGPGVSGGCGSGRRVDRRRPRDRRRSAICLARGARNGRRDRRVFRRSGHVAQAKRIRGQPDLAASAGTGPGLRGERTRPQLGAIDAPGRCDRAGLAGAHPGRALARVRPGGDRDRPGKPGRDRRRAGDRELRLPDARRDRGVPGDGPHLAAARGRDVWPDRCRERSPIPPRRISRRRDDLAGAGRAGGGQRRGQLAGTGDEPTHRSADRVRPVRRGAR